MTEHNLTGNSADILAQNIDSLRQHFPEVICEDKVDFDKLRQILGDYADDTPERYNFTWNGKGRALRLAQSPSTGTLRPCKKESKDWDTTQNLYIEGDNLEVLKLLQKTYHGKVKMIYIDPPYNTGGDFVYPDDYADNLENYLRITGQRDEDGGRLSSNTEASGRYHTNWLNMMYPRLRLARNLLRDDGVIFISIDDNEVENLRKICNDVFGEENLVAQIPCQSRLSIQNDTDISCNHEYALAYAKYRRLENRRLKESNYDVWHKKDSFVCQPLPLDKDKFDNPDNDPRGLWKADPFDAPNIRPNLTYVIKNPNTGEEYLPPKGRCWRTEEKNYLKYLEDNRIVFGKTGESRPQLKVFYEEKKEYGSIENTWFSADKIGTTTGATKELQSLFEGISYFDTPKPTSLLHKLMKLAGVKHNDLILDFFSGSATTAHAVMQLNAEDGGNRKFIMVQLQEPCDENSEAFKAGYKNICEIGKERIRRAGEKIKENSPLTTQNLDIGFKVFKLDSSNLKKWQPDRDNLEESLYNMVGNYVDGRTELDVVYEIMLKYGIDLTLPLEEYTFGGKKVYSVGLGALIICLDDDITTGIASDIAGLKTKLSPETMRVVMKDNGFKSDSVKTNVKESLKNAGVDEFVTV